MFPYLTSTEFALIARDHDQAVQGHCTKVTVKYSQHITPVPVLVPDEVYRLDPRPLNPVPVELKCVPCIMRIVHERDLKILGFGIIEVGDAILYFQDDFNSQEPVAGKPVVPGTLYFEDHYAGQWVPVLKEAGPLVRHLGMILSNEILTQVVPCKLRK